jgi:hypothetical protein
MYQFQTDGGTAGLAYQVDFARADYANISFFDASKTDILFHLSLRQTAGQAVFNRRIDDQWAAEHPVPVAFQPGPNQVALAFGPDGATVTLNGAVVMTLDAGLCPDLSRIAWHDGQGAIDAHSFQLTGPANLARKGLGGLVYVAPFAAEGWGVDPALALQDLTLQVPGLTEPLQPVTLPRPDLAAQHGLTALPQSVQIVVPGRVWLDVPDNAGLSLRLAVNGVPCGAPLRLSREAILTAIEELAARDPDSTAAEAQAFDAMLAFEHAQHGHFWPRLSPVARAYLSRTARAYHLDDLMPALTGESESAPPAPADLASAIPLDLQLMETARGALVQRLRANPSADPIAATRALPDLSDTAHQSLFHAMTEYLCTIDRFADLYQLAAAEGLAQPMPGRSAWDLSVSLPWLLMGRRYDALYAALWDLVPVQGGWFSTASLAWVIRRATRAPDLSAPPDHLERLAYALIDFIARRAVLYWERSSCSHLMDAMIDLMAAQPRLPDYLADPVTMAALRAYGLSRRFWDKLDAATDRLPPSPAVSAARHAFQTLLEPTASPADLDTALTHFDRLGAAEVERLRRELLGPLGFAPDTPQSLLLRLLAADADTAGDTALRALAFPAATPLLPPSDAEALAPLIRRTVKSRYVETGKARMFTAQDAASLSGRSGLGWPHRCHGRAADPGSGRCLGPVGPRQPLSGAGAGLGGAGRAAATGRCRSRAARAGAFGRDAQPDGPGGPPGDAKGPGGAVGP